MDSREPPSSRDRADHLTIPELLAIVLVPLQDNSNGHGCRLKRNTDIESSLADNHYRPSAARGDVAESTTAYIGSEAGDPGMSQVKSRLRKYRQRYRLLPSTPKEPATETAVLASRLKASNFAISRAASLDL